MVTTERTIEIAPGDELDRLLTDAEADGARLVLVREGVRYRVEREEAEGDAKADLVTNYDPERVRQVLAETAGAWKNIDTEQLKADIKAQRGQDSHGRPGDDYPMAYLIDSDLAIDHLGNDPDAVRLIDMLAPDGLAMNAVSLMEATQGVGRGPSPQDDAAALDALMVIVQILPFDVPEARRSANLRETLRSQGRRVISRALDLIIAATAIEHDLILVTRNVRDYRDVPGLVLYASG